MRRNGPLTVYILDRERDKRKGVGGGMERGLLIFYRNILKLGKKSQTDFINTLYWENCAPLIPSVYL